MKFNGFPARMEFTPIPNTFVSRIMPEITDMVEMKTTLHLFAILYRKRGYPRFITLGELIADPALFSSLRSQGSSPEEVLRHGLEMAVNRGTFLEMTVSHNGATERVFFLNTSADRQVMSRVRNGELELPGLKFSEPTAGVGPEPQPNVFALYEENIGMLTPMIADELREAEKLYPEAWLQDAIKEAVSLNKRSWRYISRILERWASQGRGEPNGQSVKKTDPDKYVKGKYGHLFQR
jgi:DnaD/phage-associated family protein